MKSYAVSSHCSSYHPTPSSLKTSSNCLTSHPKQLLLKLPSQTFRSTPIHSSSLTFYRKNLQILSITIPLLKIGKKLIFAVANGKANTKKLNGNKFFRHDLLYMKNNIFFLSVVYLLVDLCIN
jgi:hypothetical protein